MNSEQISKIKKLSTKQLRSLFARVADRVAPEHYDRQLLLAATVAHIDGTGIAELYFTEKFYDMFIESIGAKKNSQKRGELSDEVVRLVRELKASGLSYREIKEITGVGTNAAWYIVNGHTYRDVK